MIGASGDAHDRRGVTAGWASTNRLPAGVVNALHAGTLPNPQFRKVKEEERRTQGGQLGGRQ